MDVSLEVMEFGEPWRDVSPHGLSDSGTSDMNEETAFPDGFPPRTLMKVQAVSGSNNVDVSGHITLALVDI